MATLQAATASRGAHVTDAQAVRQLCNAHCFGTLEWEVTETGEFSIWGYDAFDVYEADDEGLPNYEAGIATRSFLRQLSAYIAPDAELDIQTAGYTKCRFPSTPSGTSFVKTRSFTPIWGASTQSTSRTHESHSRTVCRGRLSAGMS